MPLGSTEIRGVFMRDLRKYFLLLFLLFPLNKASAHQPLFFKYHRFHCAKAVTSGLPVEYCYRDASVVNSPDVIYFFHAHGGSAKSWQRQIPGTYIIQSFLDARGYRPQIISISLGEEWALTPNSLLMSVFKDKIFPFVENAVIKGKKIRKRHLIAQSMGGLTAVNLALSQPEKFSRVALMCPALATLSPHSSEEEIQRYKKKYFLRDEMLEKLLRLSKMIFPTKETWSSENVLSVLSQTKNANHLKFYLTIGRYDGYGFLEGVEKFYRLANQKGMRSVKKVVPGGHCAFSHRGTAKFILGEL